MSQIIKTFSSIFFLMLILVSGCGILAAQLDSAKARDCRDTTIAELENSDFDRAVLQECIRLAAAAGYRLQLNVYQEGEAMAVLHEAEDAAQLDESAEIELVEVLLTYEYNIPLINYLGKHQIRGYAR